jgi:hypothetical protein
LKGERDLAVESCWICCVVSLITGTRNIKVKRGGNRDVTLASIPCNAVCGAVLGEVVVAVKEAQWRKRCMRAD